MKFIKAVIPAGLIAGAMDISGACIGYMLDHNGRFPTKILEYIAGGVFGKDALTGGLPMKLWGALFHFSIAMSFTLFYFIVYPKLRLLQKNIFFSAIIYGLFVWAVMNLLVVPNSALHTPIIPFDFIKAAKAAFILMICIALPAGYFAEKYYSSK